VRDEMTAAFAVPLGRWADPIEVANAVLFLESDLSSYIARGPVEDTAGVHRDAPLKEQLADPGVVELNELGLAHPSAVAPPISSTAAWDDSSVSSGMPL